MANERLVNGTIVDIDYSGERLVNGTIVKGATFVASVVQIFRHYYSVLTG